MVERVERVKKVENVIGGGEKRILRFAFLTIITAKQWKESRLRKADDNGNNIAFGRKS